VYCSGAIWPQNQGGLENLARHIVRASFSQERMTYIAPIDPALKCGDSRERAGQSFFLIRELTFTCLWQATAPRDGISAALQQAAGNALALLNRVPARKFNKTRYAVQNFILSINNLT
jgi:hypothetical protein